MQMMLWETRLHWDWFHTASSCIRLSLRVYCMLMTQKIVKYLECWNQGNNNRFILPQKMLGQKNAHILDKVTKGKKTFSTEIPHFFYHPYIHISGWSVYGGSPRAPVYRPHSLHGPWYSSVPFSRTILRFYRVMGVEHKLYQLLNGK